MMPLFVCDKCKAIENTACGHYWGAASRAARDNSRWWKDASLEGLRLCSDCMPAEYSDGSKNSSGGKWHGRFPKETATAERIEQMGRKHFVYTANL